MTCVDNNAFAENLKYCQFVSLIIYIYILGKSPVREASCQGTVLSGKRPVREKSFLCNVFWENNLKEKRPVSNKTFQDGTP